MTKATQRDLDLIAPIMERAQKAEHQRDALLADNERLREALRELMRLHDDEQTFINGEDDNELVARTLKAGRAALSATEKT